MDEVFGAPDGVGCKWLLRQTFNHSASFSHSRMSANSWLPRFGLAQLLMAVALIAILLAFSQVEGCGQHFSRIECVSYSPSGAQIVVSRLDARDSMTPMKLYLADVSRTVSILDAKTGSTIRIVKQDLRPGNCGPAFHLWRAHRTSVTFQSENEIVVQEFGGGTLAVYAADGVRPSRQFKSLSQPAANIAMSRDGSLLVAGGMHGVSIIDFKSDSLIQGFQADDDPFLGSPILSISRDNRRLAVAGYDGVQLLGADTQGKFSERVFTLDDADIHIRALAFFPDGSLLVATNEWLRQYGDSGKMIRSITDGSTVYACSTSSDGTQVAAYGDSGTQIYDASSGKLIHTLDHLACLAFAPGEHDLACADRGGTVKLVDTDTGRILWATTAPGRYRVPWIAPASALCIWFLLAYRVARKTPKQMREPENNNARAGV